MCWIGREVDRHIAKEDVKVFKVLYTKPNVPRKFKRDFLAPFYRFLYTLNKLYESEVEVMKPLNVVGYSPLEDVDITDKRHINKALHCYSAKECFWEKTNYGHITIGSKYFQLAHYQIVDNRIYTDPPRVAAIVSGVIPAGTEYWQNEKGEIAASKLILREVKEIF
jgi:hypothetical protein